MESSAEAHTKPAESDVANDELKRLVHILYGNDLPPVLMGPIYKQHGVTNSLPALSDLPLKDSVEKGSKITSDGNVMTDSPQSLGDEGFGVFTPAELGSKDFFARLEASREDLLPPLTGSPHLRETADSTVNDRNMPKDEIGSPNEEMNLKK